MAKRLQELKYHPLGGVVPENAIVLIKDNTTAEYYEDYKLSYQDFTAKLVRQTETSTTPLVNQIPRLISGTGGVPALPAISGEFLVNADAAIPIGTDLVYGKLKLSASTSSTSGVTGGFAATPSAVKATYDAAAKKATAETVSANWTFSGTVTYDNPIKLGTVGATTGRDTTGVFLKNDGTDYLYVKHVGGLASGLVYKVGSTEYKVFHEGNDGTSSGIDADFLDGFHANVFPQKAVAETITNNWNFSSAANVINGLTVTSLTATNRATLTGGANFGSYIDVLTNARIDYNASTGADFYNLSANNAIRLHTQAYPIYRSGTTDNKIFHSGYMGVTAGLDAGSLDGAGRTLFAELADNEIVTGAWTFSGNATFSGTLTGNLTGSAASLTTARLINGTSFNGTADITTIRWGTSRNITIGNTLKAVDGSTNHVWTLAEIGALAVDANAVSATKLVTARQINGTLFDGTADITTANWGTSRTLTIGSTGKTVNGSANVSWSLTEIGAAPLGFGLGTNAQAATGSINALAGTGWYAPSNTATGTPEDGSSNPSILLNNRLDANSASQLYFDSNSTTLAWRRQAGGTWSGWETIYTTGNKPTSADTGSLPLTGGTITGNLTVNGTLTATLTGNASTATTLQTARLINGTSFNGSANITTSTWGTARNLTIGLTAKSVDGSAAVSWSLTEIGALPLTGGTLTGTLTGTQFFASGDAAFMNSVRPTVQGLSMNTTETTLGGPSATGIIYVRPQGIATTTGQTIFNANGTITASAAATATTHLIRKGEVDSGLALKANLAGATFTGKVNFNNSTTGINIQGGTGTSGTSGDFRFNTTANEFEGYSLGEWRPIGGGSGVTWVAVSANTTAEVGSGYLINSSGLTITLPATPESGESVGIGDYNGNNYSVTVARNGEKIMGKAEDFTFNLKNANIVFSYVDTTVGWILTQGFGESQAPQAIANKRRVTNVIGQSTFSVPNQGINTVDVWYNGLKLDPATDYTADSFAGTITLTVPVTANDDIIEMYNWNQALVLDARSISYDNSVTKAPVATMQAAVDYAIQQPSGMKNRIINGKMEIAQRGTSFPAVTEGAYVLDRFSVSRVTSGVITAEQSTNAPSGFSRSLKFTATTAETSLATTDYFNFYHKIEGYNISDLFGKTFTLSFWVKSSKVGNYCVSFRNKAADASYVAPYTINSANTWELKNFTIVGGFPSFGTWDTGNDMGVSLTFSVMFGGTVTTSLNTWIVGNATNISNTANPFDTVGGNFAITGVQLEAGSVATPFEHRLFGQEMLLCQRYYEKSYDYDEYAGAISNAGVHQSVASNSYSLSCGSVRFVTQKRTRPSVTFYSPQDGAAGVMGEYNSANAFIANRAVALATNGNGMSSMWFQGTGSNVVGNFERVHWVASSEF